MHILYEEQSQRAKSAEALVAVFIIALLCAVAYTTYQSFIHHTVLLSEYFIEVVALIVIIKQAVGRYRYILTDDKFIIEEKAFFRTRHWEVDYKNIDGVYAFSHEILGQIKFRYKYRKSSTSDARPIWALVCSEQTGTKTQHTRVLIKAEDAFFETLERFVPNRVRVPQADVSLYATVREDANKRGLNVDEYYKTLFAATQTGGNHIAGNANVDDN